jgi:hypothetical protein
MTHEKTDVAAELRAAFDQASPEARQLVAKVLEIERANQHLSLPRVGDDIKKAIIDAAKSGSSS